MSEIYDRHRVYVPRTLRAESARSGNQDWELESQGLIPALPFVSPTLRPFVEILLGNAGLCDSMKLVDE